MAYVQITRAQLRARLEQMTEAVPWWTTAEANDAINEALLEWSALTGRWRARALLVTTPNTFEYALPNSLLYRMRVEWNRQPLSPTNRFDLDNGRPNWRLETTASGGSVPDRPILWAPLSLRTIYIWPADALGDNSLTLDGVAETPVLTADIQFVDLSEADISTLLGYALHVLTLSKGPTWLQLSMPYFQAFLAAAAEENDLLLTSAMYRRVAGIDDRTLKPFQKGQSIGPQMPQPASA